MQNPLFPSSGDPKQDSPIPDYLQTGQASPVPAAPAQPQLPVDQPAQLPAQTAQTHQSDNGRNAAVDMVRQKLAAIYAREPDARQELAEVDAAEAPLSRHQQYMRSLQESGRTYAEIQSAWHEYYQELPDDQKREVWQEFYGASRGGRMQQYRPAPTVVQQRSQPAYESRVPDYLNTHQDRQPGGAVVVETPQYNAASDQKATAERPAAADIKQRLLDKVRSGASGSRRGDNLRSLAFGAATGAVVVFISLFTFFNEVFISPLIQPSRRATETPIIVDTASAAVGTTPKVIIPKINVEIPVDYSQTTTDEATLQKALDNGVIHYPTTVKPGEAGNAAFFGHSSNNILNPGKYKFAFVLLHKLVEGDTFYLTRDGKAYAYEVISRRVVEPTEIGVLGSVPNETATATLITCDPPGTSLKRLVVVGRQVSPDPGGNAAPAGNPVLASAPPATEIPGNGPTLWSRMWNSIF